LETCAVAAGSDSHALAVGCLLLADAMHLLTAAASASAAASDLHHHYIHLYRYSLLSRSFHKNTLSSPYNIPYF
jgi:hypothetical protein